MSLLILSVPVAILLPLVERPHRVQIYRKTPVIW